MTFLQKHSYDIGCRLALLLWPLFKKRQRISVENILKCGITDDVLRAEEIARNAFCHFAGHVFEALAVPKVINKDNWREHLDFADATPDVVKLLLDTPDTPILLVSGHHGCWEAATNLLSFARPMIAIARVMDNKILAKWMKKHHFRGPVTVINKNDGFKPRIMRQWFETKAAMTILIDQHASNGSRGTYIGRPARTVTSAARLAIRYGYPIVVGSFVRIAPFKYRLVGGDPVVFSKDMSRDEATQILNDRLQESVRKYPEQYLWMHRRWRDD
jgi:KDO2-lipid IV(A) lauroyltransferase